MSDRILIIDNGRIIAEGTPNALKEKYSKQNILEIIFKNYHQFQDLRKKIAPLNFVEDFVVDRNNKIKILNSYSL